MHTVALNLRTERATESPYNMTENEHPSYAAFTNFIEANGERLMRLIRARVPPNDWADVYQITCMAIWIAWPIYTKVTWPLALAITTSEINDFYRRFYRQKKNFERFLEKKNYLALALEKCRIDKSTGDDAKEKVLNDLRAAVKRLPPHAQRLLILRYWNGMSFETIAEKLATTPAAVKMRLCRIRRKLLDDLMDKSR